MPFPVSILFGAVFTGGASLALGRLLIRRLSLPLRREEEWLFGFLLGSALWSGVVFLLCAVHAMYPESLLALGLAAMACAVWRGAFRSPSDSLPPIPAVWKWLAIAASAPFFVLYLANAMAPEMSADGSGYHLGLVGRYFREHGFPAIRDNMYANLSQGVEMLFLSAYAFGRHSSAAMVHFLFQATLPLLMICYARRFGFATGGVAAALLVYWSPLIGVDGVRAYIDVAVAAVAFGVFYLLQIWDETRRDEFLVPIGLLAGFAYACKYTVGIAIPFAVAFVLWRSRRWRPAVLISLAAFAVMLPWLAKNAILIGNPFSPFLNTIFPNPTVQPAFEAEYVSLLRQYGNVRSAWEMPFELTIRGEALGGFFGPIFLLAPLALLALSSSTGRRLLAAALVFGSVYAANVGARFLMPALPFLALAMGSVLARIPALAALVLVAHGLSSWPDMAKIYADEYAWRLDRIFWRPALRLEAEDGFLRRRWPEYASARLIDENTPPDAVVFAFSQEPEAYTTREIRLFYQSTRDEMLTRVLRSPIFPELKPLWRTELRSERFEARRIRIVQTARDAEQWQVNELRIYDGARELPREASWRVRAEPDPWFVQQAFDNSPLTAWISGRTRYPGMHIEVDFGRPMAFDRVTLETGAWDRADSLELQAETPNGAWRSITDSPRLVPAPPTLGLRREATAEALRQGVGWILIADDIYGAPDFFERQSDWGIEYVGEANARKLYRILPPREQPSQAPLP